MQFLHELILMNFWCLKALRSIIVLFIWGYELTTVIFNNCHPLEEYDFEFIKIDLK